MNTRILIIGKTWPEPNSSAAGKRMVQLISALQKCGKVSFACAAQKSGFETLPKNVSDYEIAPNDASNEKLFRELNPDIVVFDRFMIEEQFSWQIMASCPQAARILNTEDVHFLRKAREIAYKKNTPIDFHVSETYRELASYYRSDSVLLVSSYEKRLLINEFDFPSEKLYVLPICSSGKVQQNNFDNCKDFLFVGNFLHAPNVDAVEVLKQQIWPQLSKKLPDATLNIYGAYPKGRVLQLHNENERFMVHGRTEDLENILLQHKVLLAPLQFGAGIKGKLMEAAEFGLPSITTKVGAEGMGASKDWPGHVASNWSDFAQVAQKTYTSKLKWEESIGKIDGFLGQFSSERLTEWLSTVNELIQNIEQHRKKDYTSNILLHHSMQSTKYMAKWIIEKSKNA